MKFSNKNICQTCNCSPCACEYYCNYEDDVNKVQDGCTPEETGCPACNYSPCNCDYSYDNYEYEPYEYYYDDKPKIELYYYPNNFNQKEPKNLGTRRNSRMPYHDHEARMAKAELRDMVKNAKDIYTMIRDNDEIPGWISAYITLASDYMHSVYEFMAELESDGESIDTP